MAASAADAMTPIRQAEREDLPALLALITCAFAGMKGRIDPPSSAGRLTVESLAETAGTAEIWLIGDPPLACMILTPKPGRIYLGKLAVDPDHQRQGLARRLITHAEARARALDLPKLELETRVELTENHVTFAALGFRETNRKAHPGHARPTSIIFAKDL